MKFDINLIAVIACTVACIDCIADNSPGFAFLMAISAGLNLICYLVDTLGKEKKQQG
jgi:hypothetical protein